MQTDNHRPLNIVYRQVMHAMCLATKYTALIYPMYNSVDAQTIDISSTKEVLAERGHHPLAYVTATLNVHAWAAKSATFTTSQNEARDIMTGVYVSFQTEAELRRFISDQAIDKISGEEVTSTAVSLNRVAINSSVHEGLGRYIYGCYADGVVAISESEHALVGCTPVNLDTKNNAKINGQLSHPMIGLKLFKEVSCDHPLPTYATSLSSGFDLHACISEEVLLHAGCTILIPSGVRFGIPVGYEVQIRSRSGLTLKNGIVVANSPSTIDADYSGKIGLLIHNNNLNAAFKIIPGMKIAQAILCPVAQAEFQLVDETEYHKHFVDSNRTGGFGSTGL